MDRAQANGMALNIGSGQPISIREIASELAATLGVEIPVEITGKYRAGDIRHCFADISRAAHVLAYQPQIKFSNGLPELVGWLRSQSAEDRVADALETLEVRGLVA
jgi:dTDP-L-rhamnose 4-epimerase